MTPIRKLILGSGGLALALLATSASAELNNLGLLDKVVTEFSARAKGWQTVMMNAASWLFWTLGTISLAWTGGMMVLRKADLGEFFAEFIRFILFFGFFLWLLRNGPEFSHSIITSMQQIGAQASGLSGVTPSGIVDIGLLIWQQAIAHLSLSKPIDSLVGAILSAAILLLLAAIAVNMLLLQVSGWILMYAGIFFLGFGGSRWTSDMAISYYKTVLGVGVQLLTMVLLVGIGKDLLGTFYSQMGKAEHNLNELGIMLIFCLALLMLSSKIPAMVAGIVTGGSGASGDIGSFGAGAVMGAAMGAAGAASKAASMFGSAGPANAVGGAHVSGSASALEAAYSQGAEASSDSGAGSMAVAAGDGDGNSASAFADMDQGKGSGDSAAQDSSDSESAGGEDSSDSAEGDGGEQDSGDSGSTEGGSGRDSSSEAGSGADGGGSGEDGGAQGANGQAGESGQAQPGAAESSQGEGMPGRAAGSASQPAQDALDRSGPTAGGKPASAIKKAHGPASLGATAPHHGPGQVESWITEEIEAFVNRDSRNS